MKKSETRLLKTAQLIDIKDDSLVIKKGNATLEIFPKLAKNVEIKGNNFDVVFLTSMVQVILDEAANLSMLEERVDPDKTIISYLEAGNEVFIKYSCVKKYGNETDFIVDEFIINEIKVEKKLFTDISDHVFTTINRIAIKFGENFGLVQRNGFLLYCAFTGEGKTYFALNNIDTLLRSVDLVMIFNYEITIDDYIERLANMQSKHTSDILAKYKGKLFFTDVKNLEIIFAEIEKQFPNKSIAFIVDNIDNIIGGEAEGENYQATWLILFDKFIKSHGHFGLVLSQMKKPTSERMSNDKLTSYDVSGSKNRVDLARSVMFTYYDRDTKKYLYRPLKQGSMKLNKMNSWEFDENEALGLIKN